MLLLYKENWLTGENGRAKTNEKVMREGGAVCLLKEVRVRVGGGCLVGGFS